MHAFKNYKLVLTDAYNNIPAIRKFQVFTMRNDKPGAVSCYVDPDDAPVVCDLRRRYDGIDTSDDRVRTMFQFHLDPLPHPQANTEKVIAMHTKVRPYVPAEFQDNPLYAAPTAEQEQTAKAVKQARAGARKAAAPGDATEKQSTAAAIAKDESKETDVNNVATSSESTPVHSAARAKPQSPARKRARKGI